LHFILEDKLFNVSSAAVCGVIVIKKALHGCTRTGTNKICMVLHYA